MSFSLKTLKEILPQDMRMSNFVRDERVKPFASYTAVLSFICANLVMVFLFNYFFQLPTLLGLLSIPLYVLGIIASFTVIKTSYFLRFKNTTIERDETRVILRLC